MWYILNYTIDRLKIISSNAFPFLNTFRNLWYLILELLSTGIYTSVLKRRNTCDWLFYVGGGSCGSGIGASPVELPILRTSPLINSVLKGSQQVAVVVDVGCVTNWLSVTFFPVLISHVILCVASVTVYFTYKHRICKLPVISLQCPHYYKKISRVSLYKFELFPIPIYHCLLRDLSSYRTRKYKTCCRSRKASYQHSIPCEQWL
jgi:hypothetical protein